MFVVIVFVLLLVYFFSGFDTGKFTIHLDGVAENPPRGRNQINEKDKRKTREEKKTKGKMKKKKKKKKISGRAKSEKEASKKKWQVWEKSARLIHPKESLRKKHTVQKRRPLKVKGEEYLGGWGGDTEKEGKGKVKKNTEEKGKNKRNKNGMEKKSENGITHTRRKVG